MFAQLDLKVDTLKNETWSLLVYSRTAYHIGLHELVKPYEPLCRRLQKLGSYYRAVRRIIQELSGPQYASYWNQINFTEIPTLNPVTFEPTINTLDLLNKNAARLDFDQVKEEEFKSYFSSFKPSTDTTKVTISCHCETNIALYMAKFSRTAIEIGISKASCYLCEKFMESFENRNKVKVYLSKNQGKIHSGWMLPPHASSKILKDMREKVDSEINILRESILRRRRSDSFPSNIDQEGDPVDFRVPGYSW